MRKVTIRIALGALVPLCHQLFLLEILLFPPFPVPVPVIISSAFHLYLLADENIYTLHPLS